MEYDVLFKGNFDTLHPIIEACFTENVQIISAYLGRFVGLFRQDFEGNIDVLFKANFENLTKFKHLFSSSIFSSITQIFRGHFGRLLKVIFMLFLKVIWTHFTQFMRLFSR